MFDLLLFSASGLAGAVASVVGFGIGSVLTPLLAVKVGASLAVAAISIPHVAGTLLRFCLIRSRVDRRVLLHFGILSAAGGLTGALLHSVAGDPELTTVFGILLLFAGTMSVTGDASRLRFGHKTAWVAGAVSGLLGGLVGNQGGIRSAAQLGFGLDRSAFVATATATGLIVDAARMPVYFYTSQNELLAMLPTIAIVTGGVLAGTLLGMNVSKRIPEETFRRVLGVLLIALGVFMLARR